MRVFVLTLLLPWLGSLLSHAAHAQTVYKWVDQNGEVHYSQSLPPERVLEPHERLSADGRVVERVERAPTAEERARLAAALELEKDERERERLRSSQDRLLLAAFPSEQDLIQATRQELDLIDAQRSALQRSIDSNQEFFRQLVAQAAALERQSEPVPDELGRRISDARSRLDDLHQQMDKIEERHAAVVSSGAADLERYRSLRQPERG